jgi:hypothetical protein
MEIVFVHRTNYVSALLLDHGNEVGHFDIDYNNVTASMGIGIDEPYQKKGYSKQLIRAVCQRLPLSPNKKIYIDTDASSGFWDHLGLVQNPLYDFTEEQRELEGAGYEKYITLEKLFLI